VPDDVCPVSAAGVVARHLADASAGQCGPCVNGLHDLADAVARSRPAAQIQQLADEVTGRGLCGHPGAAAAALLSASRLLAEETARHRSGHCSYEGATWPH
jgi:NADH:ubiquinone oxidoreductase subunit F (NADH-binding)